MSVTGGTLLAAYLTLFYGIAALIDDGDGVNGLAASTCAVITAVLVVAHRMRAARGGRIGRGRLASPRQASGNTAVFLAVMAALNVFSGVTHHWSIGLFEPAYLAAALVTAAVAGAVWLALRRREPQQT